MSLGSVWQKIREEVKEKAGEIVMWGILQVLRWLVQMLTSNPGSDDEDVAKS